MKLVTVLAVAGGVIAAPLIAAGTASALPPTRCDGATCVPGVPKNAALGAPCIHGTRYSFGLDPSGNTYACSTRNQWVSTKPLIGVRPLGAPCDGGENTAQSPDGIPMTCRGGASWVSDYTDLFYSKTI